MLRAGFDEIRSFKREWILVVHDATKGAETMSCILKIPRYIPQTPRQKRMV